MPNTFHRIDQLVNEWEALQPIAPEARKKLDKKFRLEFNYNSNHLEGNTLTYGETELLLYFDDTLGAHTMREYEEMKAHDAAWQLIEEWAKDMERPLTEQAVKNLNRVILVRPFWKEAITPDGQQTRREISIGNYKQYSNSVRLANGEMFDYASPMDTPVLMQELLQWYKEAEESLHPVTLAAILHYRFVRIHPFDDGNGRIARLLMNYVLLRSSLPPIIIKSIDKQNYLRALHLADTGDFDPFINYIAQQLEWSLRLSIKAAKGESIEEENDWEKKLHLLKNKVGTEERVTIKKSPEAYQLAFQNIILPFCTRWEEALQKFDPLFSSRSCFIQSNVVCMAIPESNLVVALNRFFESEVMQTSIEAKALSELQFSVGFTGLKMLTAANGINGGMVDIFYNDHNVSIHTINHKVISKLYSETIQKNETELLVDDLSNWLLLIIEAAVKNEEDNGCLNGLRT